MDPLVLTLALRWLPSVDAFSASCVCKEWRDLLCSSRDESGLWKQLCDNSFPGFTHEILKSRPDADFRQLALSLESGVEEKPRRLTPTASIENFFAVIQLYRLVFNGNMWCRSVVGSWTSPVRFPKTSVDFKSCPKPVLKGGNPLASSPEFTCPVDNEKVLRACNPGDEIYIALGDALGLNELGGYRLRNSPYGPKLRAKVTLFRRDNMKSVCILDANFASAYNRTHGTRRVIFCKEVCFDRNFVFEATDSKPIEVELSFDLIDDQSLMSSHERLSNDVLSNIPYFDFVVDNLSFRFRDQHNEEDAFQWQGEFLVALDGLNWKKFTQRRDH